MTTYTFTSLAIDIDTSTDTDYAVSYIDIELIAPDKSGFSYSIARRIRDDLPEVEISDPLYSLRIEGEDPSAWDSTDYLGVVNWSGNSTVVLVMEQQTGPAAVRQYVLEIGGDPLPQINSLTDLAGFDYMTTSIGKASGAYAPGETILFSSLPNGTSTEHDDITGDIGKDTILGGRGNDTISGEDNADKLLGGAGKDKLFGEAGNDTLKGGNSRDKLDGGRGDDLLDGGKGNDFLIGRGGADTFVFSGRFGDDRIKDFNASRNSEKIDLSDVRSIKGMNDLKNNHMTQNGTDVVIDDGNGNTVTLLNIDISDLGAGDFIF